MGGDEIVPAPGDEDLGVEAEDVAGDGVAVVVVVKEPAVKGGVAKGGLNGVEIHTGDDSAAGWVDHGLVAGG